MPCRRAAPSLPPFRRRRGENARRSAEMFFSALAYRGMGRELPFFHRQPIPKRPMPLRKPHFRVISKEVSVLDL